MSERGAAQQQDLLLRNFTETKRIERRLYAIGDWVLPTAVPVRGLVLFLLFAVPLWFIYSRFGLNLSMENLVWWLAPPFFAAALGYAVRIQGKSMTDVLTAQVSFAWWWLRHRGDSRTRTYQLLCVLWRTEHPGYQREAQRAAAAAHVAAHTDDPVPAHPTAHPDRVDHPVAA